MRCVCVFVTQAERPGFKFRLSFSFLFSFFPRSVQSRSQSPRAFWLAPRLRVLVLTKRYVGSGNEIAFSHKSSSGLYSACVKSREHPLRIW